MYEVSPGVYESSLGIVEKTDTATHAITSGQAVIWKGNVKIASSNISVGDTLSSSNLSDPSNGEFNKLSTDIGNVDAKVGTLSSLTTTAKTNIVAAVNELDSDLGTLSGKLSNMTMVKVSKTVSLPDGTGTAQTVDVDLSSFIPSGKAIHAVSHVFLGSYSIPYVAGGVTKTYITTKSSTSISITNTSTAWNNYTLSCVLFLVDV